MSNTLTKCRVISIVLILSLTVSLLFMPALADKDKVYGATQKIKVVYNANGGKVSKKSRTYTSGARYKSLPTPKRAKYTFMGWYTKTHGGSKISKKTRVKSSTNERNIYARWAPKQYFQSDGRWARRSHGKGSTIAGSGCGPSTMAMVITTIKNNGVTPATAAKWSVSRGYKTNAPGKTKSAFFTKYPAKYGITSKKVNNTKLKSMSKSSAKKYHEKAKEAVRNGDWVIAFMSPGTWTHHGHFVLWYDISGSRALVRDPNGTKASKTRNKISTLQSQAWRYYIISVPYKKMISPPTRGKVKNITTLSVRNGAGSGYSVLGTIENGNSIKITNKKNNWWKIEYNGGVGYVPQEYITVTK